MRFFLHVLFFALFLYDGACFAEEQTPLPASATSESDVADPNAPAPAPSLQIRVPHSERTKGNLLDSALDFLFVSFFKSVKSAEISYDFFEIDRHFDLVFTNMKAVFSRPDIKGTVVCSKIVVSFSEFMNVVKTKKLILSKAEIDGVSVDLDLPETSPGKKKPQNRKLDVSIKKAVLENVLIGSIKEKKVAEKERNAKEIAVKKVTAENFDMTLSNPTEKYKASNIVINDVFMVGNKVDTTNFGSMQVNGREYPERDAMIKALKQR